MSKKNERVDRILEHYHLVLENLIQNGYAEDVGFDEAVLFSMQSTVNYFRNTLPRYEEAYVCCAKETKRNSKPGSKVKGKSKSSKKNRKGS